MNPKSGKAGNVVPPSDSAEPTEADNATTGKITAIAALPAKPRKSSGATHKVKPFKPGAPSSSAAAAAAEPKKKTWVAIKLVDPNGKAVAGEAYQITLPSGDEASGTTDENGGARIDGIDPGQCLVRFPRLADDQWKKT